MEVTVLTVNYNQIDTLTRLYESIKEQREYLKEWVVYDDESTDGSIDKIKEWMKELPMKVIFGKHDSQQLIVAKMNRCMQFMEPNVFILVFGDTWLAPKTLKTISETYVPGSFGAAYRLDTDVEKDVVHYDSRDPFSNEVKCIDDIPNGWQMLNGNGMITTRDVMERIHWIDEKYPGYGIDDYDTAMRAKMNGASLYAYNNVKVYHKMHPVKETSQPNVVRYFSKLRGDMYRFEGKMITLVLNTADINCESMSKIFELKHKYPDFKVTLLNPYMDRSTFDWIQFTDREPAFTHRLEEPYWFCYGDEIVVYGNLTERLLDRINVRDDVEWGLVCA